MNLKLFTEQTREIYYLAWPVVIGQLGHIAMAVVDNVMVGQLGAEDLAAVALANSIFVLFMVMGLGVSFAISPLVAAGVGSKKQEDFRSYLSNGLFVNVAVAIVLIGLIIFTRLLLPFFDQPPVVVEKADSYLVIIGVSLLPMLIFQTYRQYIEGFGIMRPAMIIAISANLVNYLGNKALIYGNWGFPQLGIDGAGISTIATRSAMALAMILIVRYSRPIRTYWVPFRFTALSRHQIFELLRVGLGSGFQYFFEVGCFTIAVIMIGWLGAVSQAAHQIAINLASVSYMIAVGISAATAILIGRARGERDFVKLRRTGIVAVILGAGSMAVFGVLFVIGNEFWPSLYTSDPEVIRVASKLLILAAIFQVFDGAQAVGIGILRGMTDVRIPTVITFVSYWPVALVGAYVAGFIFNLGAVGVWIGLSLGLGVAALGLFARFLVIVPDSRSNVGSE